MKTYINILRPYNKRHKCTFVYFSSISPTLSYEISTNKFRLHNISLRLLSHVNFAFSVIGRSVASYQLLAYYSFDQNLKKSITIKKQPSNNLNNSNITCCYTILLSFTNLQSNSLLLISRYTYISQNVTLFAKVNKKILLT